MDAQTSRIYQLETKRLVNLLLNESITKEQVLTIQPEVLAGMGTDVASIVRKAKISKKPLTVEDIKIELANTATYEQATMYVESCLKEKTHKAQFNEYYSNVSDIHFRWLMITKMTNLLAKGKTMNTAQLLSGINRLAKERPASLLNNLGASIENKLEAILSGDDVIRIGGFLEKVSGGFTRGEISVWGARPGGGKTNTVLNLLAYLADNFPDMKILVLSREMTEEQLLKRLLLLNAGGVILYDDMRTGKPLKGKKKELAVSIMTGLKEKYSNIVCVDDARTIDDGINAILRHNPDFVIDDFIGIVEDDEIPEDQVRHLINKILREYKWLAKGLGIHIMNISQLNRKIEERLDPTPLMSDFNESGLIEQLCELCVVITREAEDKLKYWALKARHGKPGAHLVHYQPAWCKIDIGGPNEGVSEPGSGSKST